jgi:hypothetical protein
VKLWVGLVLWSSRGLSRFAGSERCSFLVVAACSKCTGDASSVGVRIEGVVGLEQEIWLCQ